MQVPLNYAMIQQYHFDNAQLQQLQQQYPHEYPIMKMGNNMQLVCQLHLDRPWHIAILITMMVDDIIHWYHLVLGPIGIV